ncbi:Nitrogen permease regulator 2 [Plasmodiophora brassicae]
MEAICVCEFDNVVGPTVSFQHPESFLSVETFEKISDYLITDEELCGKLVTLSAVGHQFVGCLVRLENPKYIRNCLIFNVVFILSNSVDTAPFSGVVKKLARLLESLELENEFFSDSFKKSRLAEMLPLIFVGLREYGECSVCVPDIDKEINLKLFPQRVAPRKIRMHEVPLLIGDVTIYKDHWDLTLQQILPYIDGVNFVKRIAQLSQVDVEIVTECLRQLLFYNLIALIDIFQFSNMYCATPRISELATLPDMQAACINFVTCRHPTSKVTPRAIFCLYTQLRRGVRIRQLVDSNFILKSRVVDVRRFITFGLVNGLIRRVHVYPMLLSSTGGPGQLMNPRVETLADMLDGQCSFDEICCRLNASRVEVENLISSIHNCVTVMR